MRRWTRRTRRRPPARRRACRRRIGPAHCGRDGGHAAPPDQSSAASRCSTSSAPAAGGPTDRTRYSRSRLRHASPEFVGSRRGGGIIHDPQYAAPHELQGEQVAERFVPRLPEALQHVEQHVDRRERGCRLGRGRILRPPPGDRVRGAARPRPPHRCRADPACRRCERALSRRVSPAANGRPLFAHSPCGRCSLRSMTGAPLPRDESEGRDDRAAGPPPQARVAGANPAQARQARRGSWPATSAIPVASLRAHDHVGRREHFGPRVAHRHAQPGGADHRQVVDVVADGADLRRADAPAAGDRHHARPLRDARRGDLAHPVAIPRALDRVERQPCPERIASSVASSAAHRLARPHHEPGEHAGGRRRVEVRARRRARLRLRPRYSRSPPPTAPGSATASARLAAVEVESRAIAVAVEHRLVAARRRRPRARLRARRGRTPPAASVAWSAGLFTSAPDAVTSGTSMPSRAGHGERVAVAATRGEHHPDARRAHPARPRRQVASATRRGSAVGDRAVDVEYEQPHAESAARSREWHPCRYDIGGRHPHDEFDRRRESLHPRGPRRRHPRRRRPHVRGRGPARRRVLRRRGLPRAWTTSAPTWARRSARARSSTAWSPARGMRGGSGPATAPGATTRSSGSTSSRCASSATRSRSACRRRRPVELPTRS